MIIRIVLTAILASLAWTQPAQAVKPDADEIAHARAWTAAKFEAIPAATQSPLGTGDKGQPFFSFTYGGKSSIDLLKTWKLQRASRQLDLQRTEHVLTYTDPTTGLVLRCVGIEYRDFPTVEWTLYFKNAGDKDTPILADIRAIDTCLQAKANRGTITLHHHTGSPNKPNDYQPHKTLLGASAEREKRITTSGGRSSDSDFPYFNLEGDGEGVIVVVGWPGQWAARFNINETGRLCVRAGQELTHFRLHPREEIRSPLIVMQFWKGDSIRAQNLWRRWMLAHNVPRPGGRLPPPHLAACSSHQYGEMIRADEACQIMFVDRYLEEGLKLDYWWMDAGWYPNTKGWTQTGTWEVDPLRFPRGLRPITDHARAKGVKSIVWFEPERVAPDTWLSNHHPEWILGGKQGGILNLGDPAAWSWLVNHVDQLLVSQGIDLYRQDFNTAPLGKWRANDTPDRQGITEIKHVTGYLAYWDELRRRHPNLLIDSCASGGRRNDLETLRRAVPLLRSDCIFKPVDQQCHTYGISSWIPLYGTGVNAQEPYAFRSQMCPFLNTCWDLRRRDLDYETLRRLIGQWRSVAGYFSGDFYPLTPYSLEQDAWMAWQFDCPDRNEGVVQVFRRDGNPRPTIQLKLQGLDVRATYTLTDLDLESTTQATAQELVTRGLAVAVKAQPGAAIITYKKER